MLIVEDDLVMADMYADMINESDLYRVCCIARTIEEAVQCAQKHDPDIALVDVRLARGEFGTALPPLLHPKVGILYSTGNRNECMSQASRGMAA